MNSTRIVGASVEMNMSLRGRHIQCINEVMLVGSGVLERQEWETAL